MAHIAHCMNGFKMAMNRYPTVLGIDSSTVGIAYCLVRAGKPYKWGMIQTKQIKEHPERLRYVMQEYTKLLKQLKPDYVYIEKSIFVNNKVSFRTLSYIVGVLIACTAMLGIPVKDIEPMVAKNFFQYSSLNLAFKKQARVKLGIKANAYCERLRKSQIQRVNEYNFPNFDASNDNISDACSIGLKGYNEEIRPVVIKSTKDIRFDMKELVKYGLDRYI